jgi:microcystin-dependent protein
MSQPYVGEIRCFGFNFAPRDWAFCNGQIIPIQQNPALFAVLGTTYGGNGQTTFGLPNLQGQIPMHWGNGPAGFVTVIGEPMGVATVTLLQSEMPQHNHQIEAADPGNAANRIATPTGTSFLSASKGATVYQKPPVTPNVTFSPRTIGLAGGTLPHDNMQPYLTLNICIALFGIFPSRN